MYTLRIYFQQAITDRFSMILFNNFYIAIAYRFVSVQPPYRYYQIRLWPSNQIHNYIIYHKSSDIILTLVLISNNCIVDYKSFQNVQNTIHKSFQNGQNTNHTKSLNTKLSNFSKYRLPRTAETDLDVANSKYLLLESLIHRFMQLTWLRDILIF